MAKFERLTIQERRVLSRLCEGPYALTVHALCHDKSVGMGWERLTETLDGLVSAGLVVRIPARTPEHDSTHPRYRRFYATRSGREDIGKPPLSLRHWHDAGVRKTPPPRVPTKRFGPRGR